MIFNKGNVVKWRKRLYIVAEDNGDKMRLLSIDKSNCSAHPSNTWPVNDDDKPIGRPKVKYVADNVKSWIQSKIWRTLE